MRTAQAVRSANGSGHAVQVTLEELAAIPTPQNTATWTPIPHIEVVNTIRSVVLDRKWKIVGGNDAFKVVVSNGGVRMFGTVAVKVPDISDSEFGLMLGFRQGHDKMMALRMAFGEHVFVCSNMVFNGDIVVRREHTRFISVTETIDKAITAFQPKFIEMIEMAHVLQKKEISAEMGDSLLVRTVEAGALPLANLLPARKHWLSAINGDCKDIEHAQSVWGVKQAVTSEFKGMSRFGLLERSKLLGTVINEVMSRTN